MLNCIFVGIGGFFGSILRYLIGLVPLKHSTVFPFKTLIINIVGSFIIGILCCLATKNKDFNPQLLLLLKVGLCGGFTTFSTFAFESADLLNNGHAFIALSYIVLSVALSVAAVFISGLIVK